MHRLILVFIPLFFITVSCKKGLPEGILKKEAMVELLTDVHTLDGYLTTIPIDSAKAKINTLYNDIFMKYGIDSSTFNKNIDYYYGNPQLTSQIYDDVIKVLRDKENIFVKEDSLRNVQYNDSLRIVTLQDLKYRTMLKSILDYKSDSLKYGIAEITRRTLSPTGLEMIWKNQIYEKPVNALSNTDSVKNVPLELKSDTLKDKPQQNDLPVELKPIDGPSSNDVRRAPIRPLNNSKPVKARKKTPPTN